MHSGKKSSFSVKVIEKLSKRNPQIFSLSSDANVKSQKMLLIYHQFIEQKMEKFSWRGLRSLG